MIHLIGINDAVQNYKWSKDKKHGELYAKLIKEFKTYLKDVIKDYEITVLAEEYNEEALGRTNDKSVLKDIAESLSLTHLYCDPNEEERQSIGMPSYNEMRGIALKILNIEQSFIDVVLSGDRELVKRINKQIELIGKQYWHLREQFWFDKIKMHIDKNILFIIGAWHIASFSDLIKLNGCKFSVINEDWNKEKFPPEDC